MLTDVKRLEKRWYPRIYDVGGKIPGIFNAGTGEKGEVTCEVLDVSMDGLGMVVSRRVEKDTQLAIVMAETLVIKLKVVHCAPDPEQAGQFIIGLRRTDGNHNLVEILAEYGLIRSKSRDWWA